MKVNRKEEILKRRLGIDIDGVIRDLYIPLKKMFQKEFEGFIRVKDISDWNDYRIHKFFYLHGEPIKEQQFKYYWFVKFAKEIYLDKSKPYSHAVKYINDLYANYQIILISSQPNSQTMKYTLEWLDKYAILYDELHFTQYGQKEKVKCDLYLDDSPSEITALRKHNENAWYFDQPWNRTTETPSSDFMQRVWGWQDYARKVRRRFQI
jgi:uncharacterized HAD superfamily protein